MTNKTEKSPQWGKRLSKGLYYSTNIILPLSEVRYAASKIGPSLFNNFKRLKYLSPSHQLKLKLKEPILSFEQAVAASGLPVSALLRRFKRRKVVCLILAAVPSLLAIGLLLAVAVSGIYTPLLLAKALVLVLVLLSLAAVPFVQALVCTWRLWQLNQQRASPEERGGFSDFLGEVYWFKSTISSSSQVKSKKRLLDIRK
ncbi:conjugal transfer protein TraX (plasmid) [Yersinia massiliensis]|uniref:conjugal transfer protein TraX n=1 Tax=Yersinia massiliensis TaxID=419257 RepID=UPI001562E2D2|nr:conjugal transfer protein TraX [Yersinia massiliensis]QKJ09448.1 conjugal transfer protein TraX [Yersinia massiliensis]